MAAVESAHKSLNLFLCRDRQNQKVKGLTGIREVQRSDLEWIRIKRWQRWSGSVECVRKIECRVIVGSNIRAIKKGSKSSNLHKFWRQNGEGAHWNCAVAVLEREFFADGRIEILECMRFWVT